MGSYNTAVVTTAGQALLTSVLGSQGTLTFSKFQTSSYQYASGTDLSALTSLNDVEQEVSPNDAGVIDSTSLFAQATVSNTGLAAEYTAYTLGMFASDGVNEVLFAVATAITPDVIPEDTGGTPSTYTYKLILTVSSTSDITINVTTSTTAAEISYNNTSSGLNATNVQDALDEVASGIGGSIPVLIVTASAVSSLPTTINDANITADDVVVKSVLSNPSAQIADNWTCTTAAGTATIAGTISGTTDITLYLSRSH